MAAPAELSSLERLMEETKPTETKPKPEEPKPTDDAKPVEEKTAADDKATGDKKPDDSKEGDAKNEANKDTETKKPDGGAKRASDASKPADGGAKRPSDANKPADGGAKRPSDANKPADGGAKRPSDASKPADGGAKRPSNSSKAEEGKKPDESLPKDPEGEQAGGQEQRESSLVPTSKSNKALVNKASRAIAELKANMAKNGLKSPLSMKKEKKGKVLSITQQMDSQMTARDDHVFKAKMAQTIERWDEMVHWVRKVAVIRGRVNVDERNLISCAYGNACKSRREAWTKITALELKERSKPESKGRNKRILRTMYYRHSIEQQLKKLCSEILGILDKHLITHAKTAESKVFFFKMQGDFNRYLAEISFRPKERRKYTMLSMGSYKAAAKIGHQELPVTHPIRLANGLNYAILWYDLMDNPERACRITKNTFDLSIMELDIMKGVSEELVDCAQDLMHSLRDNITLWARAFDPDWHHGLQHTQSRFVSHAPVKGNKAQPSNLQSSYQSTPQGTAEKPSTVKQPASVKQLFKAGAKPRGNSR